ncbi:MAG: class I SAM-dependent methyltransferase [Limnochordia bacterium]|jgi:SAM-dependent methyltransferase
MGQAQIKRAWLLRRLRERYEHPEEVRAYADQVAQGLTPEEAALLTRTLPGPCRIANIGCGAGREALALWRQGYHVVALDISRAMLRVARQFADEQQAELPCVWMPNPLRLPLSDATFDCVIALAQLLSHIPGAKARIALLAEVRRVLAPGGLLVASVTDRQAAVDLYDSEESVDDALISLAEEAGWEEGDIWVWQPSAAELDTPLFFHLHTRQEMERELRAAGLQLVEYVGGHELTPLAAPDAHRYRFVVAR